MSIQLPDYTKLITSTRILVPSFLLVFLVGLAFGFLFKNPYAKLFPISLLTGTRLFILLPRNRQDIDFDALFNKLVWSKRQCIGVNTDSMTDRR